MLLGSIMEKQHIQTRCRHAQVLYGKHCNLKGASDTGIFHPPPWYFFCFMRNFIDGNKRKLLHFIMYCCVIIYVDEK